MTRFQAHDPFASAPSATRSCGCAGSAGGHADHTQYDAATQSPSILTAAEWEELEHGEVWGDAATDESSGRAPAAPRSSAPRSSAGGGSSGTPRAASRPSASGGTRPAATGARPNSTSGGTRPAPASGGTRSTPAGGSPTSTGQRPPTTAVRSSGATPAASAGSNRPAGTGAQRPTLTPAASGDRGRGADGNMLAGFQRIVDTGSQIVSAGAQLASLGGTLANQFAPRPPAPAQAPSPAAPPDASATQTAPREPAPPSSEPSAPPAAGPDVSAAADAPVQTPAPAPMAPPTPMQPPAAPAGPPPQSQPLTLPPGLSDPRTLAPSLQSGLSYQAATSSPAWQGGAWHNPWSPPSPPGLDFSAIAPTVGSPVAASPLAALLQALQTGQIPRVSSAPTLPGSPPFWAAAEPTLARPARDATAVLSTILSYPPFQDWLRAAATRPPAPMQLTLPAGPGLSRRDVVPLPTAALMQAIAAFVQRSAQELEEAAADESEDMGAPSEFLLTESGDLIVDPEDPSRRADLVAHYFRCAAEAQRSGI
jgi:hypothetical protein